MQEDLFGLLVPKGQALSQDEHFKADHLADLFHNKIAKTHATGKDGVRVGRFADRLVEEVGLIEARVASRSYRFTPYKERLILRGASRRPRQISIPTVRDRLTLRAVCQVLHTTVPETLGHSPHTLVKRIVATIKDGDQSSKVFLRIDVRDFFPSVTHPILMRELTSFKFSQNVQALCQNAVKTPTGAEKKPNPRGIPQGLSISGALASLYMQKFDYAQIQSGRAYFRYVDDILIVCEKSEADGLLKEISRKLKARGLSVHPKGVAGKTEISPVGDGVDFLGYKICVDKISIRKSSYDKMFKNTLKIITDFKHRKNIDRALFRLNLKITGCVVDNRRRGWMMFFSYTQDMSQLSYLDSFIKRQLKSAGFPSAKMNEVKTFIKSYNEIRFNLESTKYIPNFNNYSQKDKIDVIVAMTRFEEDELAAWDIQDIDDQFSRVILREIQDLERDIGTIS